MGTPMRRGAAHDVSNILTVINGQCELARREIKRGESDNVPARLNRIEELSMHCWQILHEFFTQAAELGGKFDLNRTIRNVAELMQDEPGIRIELALAAAGEPIIMDGDVLAMKRALFNLCMNARGALGNLDGGLMKIVTTRNNDETVTVFVSDTGCGMSPARCAALWTTAPTGAHGHGLSLVKRTIDEFRGVIHVASTIGQGTTFMITLPVAPAQQIAGSFLAATRPAGSERPIFR
jgi:signal transduction histidine kinase